MIRQQWYAIYPSKQLGRRPVPVRRLGRDLVLWRDDTGKVACFPDRCAHRAAALSRGRVRDGCIECPYHGIRYAADGRIAKVPALGKRKLPTFSMETLTCRESRGLIWMWHGDVPRDDALPDLPWDDELQAELGTGVSIDLQDQFDVSYLRVMENSTDIFHVPFVHRTTVPVGEVLEDFSCETEGVHIRVRGKLTDTQGRSLSTSIHVVAPSLLLFHVSEKARFLAVATPIDEDHTWLFARYMQQYVTLPGLGSLVSWALGVFDYRLLQRYQDAPVWRSQRLHAPHDIRGYHLIEGDRGVAAYFQIRKRLLREAAATHDRCHHTPRSTGDQLHRNEPDAAVGHG